MADQDAFKSDWWEIFDKIEEPPGDKAIAEARRRAEVFVAQWERPYPSAVACLVEDFAALAVHLRLPREHWHGCRHTNLISVNWLTMPVFVRPSCSKPPEGPPAGTDSGSSFTRSNSDRRRPWRPRR